MPIAVNDGVRIYYEFIGEGVPVVLQHGFSDSLESFRECGYVDGLAERHQLILIDARGHGQSEKPHDPALYSLVQLAGDVTAVLDALEIEKAHFFGYSMGGRIGFGLARYAPDRLRSLMIGGIPPYRNVERHQQFIEFLAQGIDAFAAVWEAQASVSPALMKRLLANDLKALSALQEYRIEHDDSVERALLELTCPYQLIAGDEDVLAPYAEILEYATRLPDGALITLPGLNHLDAFQRSDVVLPYLSRLITRAGDRT